MRLIDADAIIDRIDERIPFEYSEYANGLADAIQMIGNAPIIDAFPAEWAKKWFTRHIDEMFEDYELERDDRHGFNADTIRALANPEIPVVHCAVCRFRGNPYCPLMTITEDARYDSTEDDDFCSYGERRDDEQNV